MMLHRLWTANSALLQLIDALFAGRTVILIVARLIPGALDLIARQILGRRAKRGFYRVKIW